MTIVCGKTLNSYGLYAESLKPFELQCVNIKKMLRNSAFIYLFPLKSGTLCLLTASVHSETSVFFYNCGCRISDLL